MIIRIIEIGAQDLADYARVSIAYVVNSILCWNWWMMAWAASG